MDIFAGIDGTQSHGGWWIAPFEPWEESKANLDHPGGTATNSHIYDFYKRLDTQGGRGQYFAGPQSILLGSDVSSIASDVLAFVKGELRKNPTARIVLVGHSRGGLVAIEVARRLKGIREVYFLGLYDAVDRSFAMTSRIENVLYVYHAIRSFRRADRIYFGHTGTTYTHGVEYHEKEFWTTHGGIGGDIPDGYSITSDEAGEAHFWMKDMARVKGIHV